MTKALTIDPPLVPVSEFENVRPITLVGGMSLLPVKQQETVLKEYDARRSYFLSWLFSHLKEGIHYGFPPGCDAKYDAMGNMIDSKGHIVKSTQWIAKPSLYDAGAKLVVDLLKLKPVYENDTVAWEMMGKPAGTIVRTCRLVDQASGNELGTGTGAFQVGAKGMDANSAVKMADKRAAVASVRNSVPVIGELFTQDIELKQAERTKGNLQNRKRELLQKVTTMLIDKKSKWAGDPADWLRTAIVSSMGAGVQLTSIGAIDKFEAVFESGAINIDTAEVKK
jgi:hypothetical protein